MFTGLVEALGMIRRIERQGPNARMTIEAPLGDLPLGASISVNGVCLTVDAFHPRSASAGEAFEADISAETLARTTLQRATVGTRTNLEQSTPLGGRMGGHVVLGHVDGLGEVRNVTDSGDARGVQIWAPASLGAFVAEKGSIALDGVSLTVNSVVPGISDGGVKFEVMLVPHTLQKTTLSTWKSGQSLNIEVDVLARYVARQLSFGGIAGQQTHDNPDDRLLAKLKEGGYT